MISTLRSAALVTATLIANTALAVEPFDNSPWRVTPNEVTAVTLVQDESGEGLGLAFGCNEFDDNQTILFTVIDQGNMPEYIVGGLPILAQNANRFTDKDTMGLKLKFTDGTEFHAPFKGAHHKTVMNEKAGVKQDVSFVIVSVPDAAVDHLKSQSTVQFFLVIEGDDLDFFRPFSLKGSGEAMSQVKNCT